jgi:N-acyl amino acid synthase of PEP-CTERM/exosortase system
MFDKKDVLKLLQNDYELEFVTTPSQFQALKEIRLTVYMEKYNKSRNYLERIGVIYNHEDEQSFIYLLKHRHSGRYVGTVRSYFVNRHTPPAPLPMNQTVPYEITEPYMRCVPFLEVSRLALIKKLPSHPDFSALKLHTMLTFVLFSTVRITATVYPVEVLFTIMEPALHRILKRRGISFHPISDAVDSYGTKRIPYISFAPVLFKETEKSMGDITRYHLKRFCFDSPSFQNFIRNHPYLRNETLCLDALCEIFQTNPKPDFETLLSVTGYDREPCTLPQTTEEHI